jgi:hypothetical protein
VLLATDLLVGKANRESVRARLKERRAISSLTEEEEYQLEDTLVRDANRVVLKVMTQLDQFERELSARGLPCSGGPGNEWGPGGAREATGLSSLARHQCDSLAQGPPTLNTNTYTFVIV